MSKTHQNRTYPEDRNLTPVLRAASNEELEPIVDSILNANVSEELSKHPFYIRHKGDHVEYVEIIEKEIRRFGGHSGWNLLRRLGRAKERPYREIVCIVAKHVGAEYDKYSSIEDIEEDILSKVMGKDWPQVSEEDRLAFIKDNSLDDYIDKGGDGAIPRAVLAAFPAAALKQVIKKGGFAPYKIAVQLANAVAKKVLGRGLTFGANAAFTQGMKKFATASMGGPPGWIAAGALAAWDINNLAGPALRVLEPCVIFIAALRRKQKYEAELAQRNYVIDLIEVQYGELNGQFKEFRRLAIILISSTALVAVAALLFALLK
jgi:uncharacterized protein YaaW (UPF0174 family)